jgi:hypothetical protein
VFLIGLTGGAVLRQWAVNDRTPTETNSPIEPAVEAVAAAPPTGPQAGSSSRDVPHGPTAPDQITSTSVTVPPTTAPPRFATVVAPDANKAPPATLGTVRAFDHDHVDHGHHYDNIAARHDHDDHGLRTQPLSGSARRFVRVISELDSDSSGVGLRTCQRR